MRFPWHSRKQEIAGGNTQASYISETVIESRTVPGVSFTIAKISFARRVELMRRIRDLSRRTEYLAASQDAADKFDAALLQADIDRLYVTWGVKEILGLVVDGTIAGPDRLADAGPEELFREALAAVRREIGLSAEERKNS